MLCRTLPWIIGFALGAGCGSAPTSPGRGADFAGTWTGSVTDDGGTAGIASIVLLQQDGPGVSGTFMLASTTPAASVGGTASGTVTGATLMLFMVPTTPLTCSPTVSLSGSLNANLTLANGRLTGRYVGLTCGSARSGSFDLSR